MEQSIKTLRTNQKRKVIIFFWVISFSSLIIGISFNLFKTGFIFSVLCWVITGVIESSYKQEESDNTSLFFSPHNFVIIGSVGIGLISLLTILIFFTS
ncbi:MAG: hypothetical protein JSW11_11895 [Candidatus Heimdallarchaeota archaeon]|nr:MAG: hypothetical protein JSW11_11895 [Candidatus Heimdallarchaeota archaeon]